MKNIIELIPNFGAIDAENDDRLLDYFIQSESLKRVMEFKKSIIVGRKGSGKSAIYRYLSNPSEDKLTTALLFRDYPWKIHDRFKNEVVTERESYVNSWLFLIYIEFIKLIVSDINSYGWKDRKQIKRLKKWLIMNWGSYDFNYKETMNPKSTKISYIFSPSILGNSLGSIVPKDNSSDNLGQSLSEFNKKLEKIVFTLLKPDKIYYLLFDELDLGYDPTDKNYISRIIGLLISDYYISSKFQQNNKINVGVSVFLRSDIYDIVEFQDKNKITDNFVEFLKWNAENENTNLSLKEIVSKRIQQNTNSQTDEFQANWNLIFEPSNIGSNQLKWNFITERTFLRPRDLIKFLNLSLEEAKKRIEFETREAYKDKIINKDIHNIRKDYSDYLYSELKDEVNAKYKDFNSYLEVLRDIHKTSFSSDEFEGSFSTISSRLNIIENCTIVLERLYEFSVIGFYKPGGGGYGGSIYCYQYINANIKFNPKAQKYKVHPGFKEYLELIDG